EIAMEGGKDHDNRRCFPWGTFLSEEKNEFFHFFKDLIAWRKNESALIYGTLNVRLEHNNLCLQRIYGKDCVEMLLQRVKNGFDFEWEITKTLKTC
ncbi:MAG: hypothetical protein UIH18_09115, partial [Fibrobacteraceae bacterium]|nr:hypothetical protein [Fibrobacteraceae bacterium]